MSDRPKDPAHAPQSTARRALHSVPAWLRFALPAVVGIALDLWSKAYAFPDGVPAEQGHQAVGLHPHDPPLVILPKVLGFQTTVNHGAVFGVGQGQGWLFILFSFVALAAIIYVFVKSTRQQWVLHVALGLITAGAIGNLYDRVIFGGVRDMLKFVCFAFADAHGNVKDYYPYIFNVADVLLCIGVPLLMIVWIFTKDPAKEAAVKPAGKNQTT